MFRFIQFAILFIVCLAIATPLLAQSDPVVVPYGTPISLDGWLNFGYSLLPLLATVFSLWALIRSGKVKEADETASSRLRDYQLERSNMEQLERAYQNANQHVKTMFDVTYALVSAIAPITSNIKVDDAVSKFMFDVKNQGNDAEALYTSMNMNATMPPPETKALSDFSEASHG